MLTLWHILWYYTEMKKLSSIWKPIYSILVFYELFRYVVTEVFHQQKSDDQQHKDKIGSTEKTAGFTTVMYSVTLSYTWYTKNVEKKAEEINSVLCKHKPTKC